MYICTTSEDGRPWSVDWLNQVGQVIDQGRSIGRRRPVDIRIGLYGD